MVAYYFADRRDSQLNLKGQNFVRTRTDLITEAATARDFELEE